MTRSTVVLLALLAAGSAGAAPAQTVVPVHPGLQFAGCWSGADGVGAATARTCVIPEDGRFRVVAIVDGAVKSESSLRMDGTKVDVATDGCTGWEQARLTDDGERLLVSSEIACTGQPTQKRETAWAITPAGLLMQASGTGLAMIANAGLRAFQPVESYADIPADTRTALLPYVEAAERARLRVRYNAVSVRDLAEFERLGVAAPLVDLMVAVSYPKSFVVDLAGQVASAPSLGAPREAQSAAPVSAYGYFDPGLWGYPMMSAYDWQRLAYCMRFATASCSAYAYGGIGPFGYYNYGAYPGWGFGGYTIPVVVRPVAPSDPASGGAGGRAVRGRGYTQTGAGDGSTAQPRNAGTSNSGGNAAARGSSGGSAGSGGGASSAPAPRTAKPRDP